MINPPELNTDLKYFSNESYMSVSRFKRLQKCEVAGLQPFGQPSESMLIGSYVDAYVEGTLDKFILEHPEIISSRGKTKGQLKSGFKQAQEICNFIDNDKNIQQFLQGDKQTVMTGEIMNVPFKIKMDIYAEGITINDLKCMRSITSRNGDYFDFITSWGYHYQLACYQEIVRQNTGDILPCFIIVVTKETPIDSAIINIPQYILDDALKEVEEGIVRAYNVFQGKEEPIGCGKCKVCIENRKETPIISMEELMEVN